MFAHIIKCSYLLGVFLLSLNFCLQFLIKKKNKILETIQWKSKENIKKQKQNKTKPW